MHISFCIQLIALTIMLLRFNLVACGIGSSFSVLCYSFPFYDFTRIYPFTVDGHLGCFQFGTIMKTVAKNMFLMFPGTYVHTQRIYVGEELLAHRLCIFSTSLDTIKLYTKVAPIPTSTISVWEFLLLHILTNTWHCQQSFITFASGFVCLLLHFVQGNCVCYYKLNIGLNFIF